MPPILQVNNLVVRLRTQDATVPGLAIMLASLGMNLLGDWLRDVLDPRLRRSRR